MSNRGSARTKRVGPAEFAVLTIVCLVALMGFGATSALAGTGEEIEALPVLDPLNRSEEVLSNGSKWGALAWDNSTSSHNTGRDTTAGWSPYDAWPTINGAYWSPTSFSGSSAAAITMNTSPGNAERHLGLWVDLSSPGSAKSGYQLRWTVVSGTTFEVELVKFASGTETVLASNSAVTIAAGSTLAISDVGGAITAWQGSGSALTSLLSASDSTYSSGYAGIEGSGNISRSTNFKAGSIGQPPNTTLTSGPKGSVVPNVSFAFSSSEAGGSLECSLDGAAYAPCSSPKAYESLAEGAHAFKARAVNSSGPDATPVERAFTVYNATKAVKTTVRDDFLRAEIPLATSQWTKFGWGGEIGGVWNSGYKGYGSSGSSLAAAYWDLSTFNDSAGTNVTAAAIGTGAPAAGEYEALWLNVGSPASWKNGYEARFGGLSGSQTNLTVELAKWVSGTRTVLASATGISLPAGATIAITETPGGSLAVWGGTSTVSQIVAAQDSAYTSGYAGLEVQGGAGTLYNFRAGNIDTVAPDTTITSGPTGSVLPSAVTFGFSATEPGSTFECSLDAAAFAGCTSPKSYPTISQGAHNFRVRGVDGAGNADATPAERSFTVIKPPTVSTSAASSLGGNGATLNGSVNPEGAATTYQFEYGTTTAYGTKVPVSAKEAGSGTTAVSVSEPITGLTPGTTYHFRITATNANGTSNGIDRTFTTPTAPVITLDSPTEIEAQSLTFRSKINPKGAATTYQVEYGTTTSYGSKVPATPKEVGAGTINVAVSQPVTGLQEGTTYHYRVVATNSVGTTVGVDQTVETPFLPSATTMAASQVEANEAIVNASVDPNGQQTTYQFEYGTTTAYGNAAPIAPEEIRTGTQPAPAEEGLAFLQPETTYHYRVVAKSSAGVVKGADQTLTTDARAMSAEAEAQAAKEELGLAELASPPPGDFMNMMWSGENALELKSARMRAIKKSGSTYLRHSILWEEVFAGGNSTTPDWTFYDNLFRVAAEKGVTILPDLGGNPVKPGQGFPTPSQGYTKWNEFVSEAVNKYGPNGSFWNTIPAAQRLPVKVWEVGNENNYGGWNYEHQVNPEDFGAFLKDTSEIIKGWKPSSEVVLGGLLSVGTDPGEPKMTVGTFLENMHTGRGSFDYLGLHPYAFKVKNNGYEGAPRGPQEVDLLTKTIRANVQKAHAALVKINRPGAPIWITELGFPVKSWDSSHLAVSEPVQGELVTSVFRMLKANWERFNIRTAFYYNDHDIDVNDWAYHSGLQGLDNHYRKAWYAFLQENGQPRWPKNPRVEVTGVNATSSKATVSTLVDPYGSPTTTRVLFGESSSYGATASKDAGSEEGAVAQAIELPNLLPNRTYHYKVIAENETGDKEETTDRTFATEPITVLTGGLDQTLNGEPGWVSFSGWLKHDQVGMNGVRVNVNFSREIAPGQFQYVRTEQAQVVNGQWQISNMPLGKGTWEWHVVFNGPEQGYPSSWTTQTNPHPPFTIKNAYQLVARHSGKCIQAEGTANTSGVTQRTCTDPQTTLKQDFTLVPQGNAYYQLVVRNSNRCLDVRNASQTQNTSLQVYDCLGFSQANQIWKGIAVEALPDGNVWAEYIAKHSNQCLSVLNGSTGEAAEIVQAGCGPTGAQQWKFLSVEANQVPVNASITVDEVLDGHPGYVTFHGNVTSNGYNMDGYWANVNFQREVSPGNWETVDGESVAFDLPPNGSFNYSYWGVGSGNWRTRVVLQGSGPLESGASEYRYFTVRDGYKLKFRHSGRCLSTSSNGTANGTAILQWDCGPPNAYDGQTYTFRPVGTPGSNLFQIRPDTAVGGPAVNSGMCLDVTGASQTQGAKLQLWQCLGEGQTNQIWHIVPIAGQPPYFAAIAQHSGQCMDVANVSVNNGALFQQWGCTWGGNQQWQWIPVG